MKQNTGNHHCSLMSDNKVIERILRHIDRRETDMGKDCWREPTENYLSGTRFQEETKLLARTALLFCPSAVIPECGSYTTRDIQGVPLLVVRDDFGQAKAYTNSCRHRGVKIATGSGKKRAFTCPYHSWTYGIDGSLKVIPHEHGFPQINKCDKGLVPVDTVETKGLIFVCLSSNSQFYTLQNLPMLVPDGYHFYEQTTAHIEANWKTVIESFLEGYHIKSTHPKSFYPVQYDNINVVEHFGPHNRVCFPYRAIEKLRDRTPDKWHVHGKLTYVYQLFPNIIVSTHPGFRVITSIEPLATNKTIQTTYVLSNMDTSNQQQKHLLDTAVALAYSSIDEDRNMILSAQAGLASKGNEHLEFGLFESAIVHFHSTLKQMLNADIPIDNGGGS